MMKKKKGTERQYTNLAANNAHKRGREQENTVHIMIWMASPSTNQRSGERGGGKARERRGEERKEDLLFSLACGTVCRSTARWSRIETRIKEVSIQAIIASELAHT